MTRGARYLQLARHCLDTYAPFASPAASRSVALKEIEGDGGTVKAETCDDCHTYAKMLYKRTQKVDPFADDLATQGLDVLVAEAGWSRHAPNPLLLVG
jgi:FdhE protein